MYTKEMIKEVVDQMSNENPSTACQDVYLSPILYNPCIYLRKRLGTHAPSNFSPLRLNIYAQSVLGRAQLTAFFFEHREYLSGQKQRHY